MDYGIAGKTQAAGGGKDLLDSYHDAECSDLGCSRPNASPSNVYDLRLDPAMKDVSTVPALLKPYDARLMRCVG